MPLDVYDKNNKHLGIIHKKYDDNLNIYMVAITDLKVKDIELDMNKIRKFAANCCDSLSLLGKVKEEKFEKGVRGKRQREVYKDFSTLNDDDFIKIICLKSFYGEKFHEFMGIDIKEDFIKGYILLDLDKVQVKDGTISIDEDINYIPEKNISDEIPVYAKVKDYPIVETEIMGLGGLFLGADLADMGGRNHIHITKLQIQSGNYQGKLEIPIMLNAKKDMNIQLFIPHRVIEGVFCDGVIYRFYKC